MTVILVLLTLLAFIVLDALLTRQKASQPAARPQPRPLPGVLQPSYVEGFLVPEALHYHPGHSWLLRERKHVVRVGADEFAAALAGQMAKVELPKPGQWLRQGQKAWTFYRNGEKAEMVSPIEGEVLEVNPEVLAEPSLI